MITLPALNPNKFFKDLGKKNIDNLSFKDFSEHRDIKGNYFKQSFLEKAKNIYYKPFLSGVYGFTESNVTITNDPAAQKQTTIFFNVIELGTRTALNPYPVTLNLGVAEINKRLAIKSNYQIDVQLLENTTVIETLDDVNPINGLVTIPLNADYTNLVVKVRSDLAYGVDVEIKGIAVVEDSEDYTFNDFQRTSKLIDISQYGAVYCFGSESETEFLPVPSSGSEYSDIIRKYEIDLTPVYDDREKLILTFDNGGTVFEFGGSLDGFPVLLGDRIPQVYDFISHYVLYGDPPIDPIKLIVEVAHYELTKVEITDTNNGNPNIDLPVTYLSQRIDDEYWYQVDGNSEQFINVETATIEIDGVIRAKKELDFNNYRDYLYNGNAYVSSYGNAGTTITNINSFPAFLPTGITDDYSFQALQYGGTNGELIKIKKIAQIQPLTNCGKFEIDGYISEPFEIINQQEANEKKLSNLTYSNSEDAQGLAFDNFIGGMLLPFYLESDDTQEVTVFNGQYQNVTRGSENLKTENYTAYVGIPVYLKVMLQMIFNFDILKVDGVDYAIVDKAESEQIEKTLFYTFIVQLRESNYNYLNS